MAQHEFTPEELELEILRFAKSQGTITLEEEERLEELEKRQDKRTALERTLAEALDFTPIPRTPVTLEPGQNFTRAELEAEIAKFADVEAD